LLTAAFLASGYYLLWKNKSKQPKLIAIWALFMANCIEMLVQSIFFAEFIVQSNNIDAAFTFMNYILFTNGHWILSFSYFFSSIEIEAIV
jgi:hypothetical protein